MSFHNGRHYDKYNCDDAVNSYLRHCIEKLEGMSDVQEIAGVMHSFVERYVHVYNSVDTYITHDVWICIHTTWYVCIVQYMCVCLFVCVGVPCVY